MNEIINKIFVVGEFKRQAEFELNEFKKEFGEYIAKNFSDRVILKNGVEIIAISAIEFQHVKVRDFKACYSKDFMRYVYRNKVKELQQENQQLKIQVSSREEVANKYKEVIEEVKNMVEDSSLEVNTREYGMLTVCDSDNILQILDKAKEVIKDE